MAPGEKPGAFYIMRDIQSPMCNYTLYYQPLLDNDVRPGYTTLCEAIDGPIRNYFSMAILISGGSIRKNLSYVRKQIHCFVREMCTLCLYALVMTNYVMFHVKHICDKYVAPFVHGHMTVYVLCTLSM